MKIEKVTSSRISRVAYDAVEEKMYIEFPTKTGGQWYVYSGVAPHVHADLMAADSIGTHFGLNIKGQYSYAKCDEPEEE